MRYRCRSGLRVGRHCPFQACRGLRGCAQADNVDYNDIKRLIKQRTTSLDVKAVSIPGQSSSDSRDPDFERELYDILCSQHERIELFYKSKVTEIRGGLVQCSKELSPAETPSANAAPSDRRVAAQRRERRARREGEIRRIGQELEALSRYSAAQKTALLKLLKKYRKWTGSSTLESRITNDLFRKSSIFHGKEARALLGKYTKVLATVPSPSRPNTSTTVESITDAFSIPTLSSATSVNETTTPGRRPSTPFNQPTTLVDGPATALNEAPPESARKPASRSAKGKGRSKQTKSHRRQAATAPPLLDAPATPRYWNEFDDADHAPESTAPYTIDVDPDTKDPLTELMSRVAGGTASAYSTMRGWFRGAAAGPHGAAPRDPERQPLAPDYFSFQPTPQPASRTAPGDGGPASAPASASTYATFPPRMHPADDSDSASASPASVLLPASRMSPASSHPLLLPRTALAFYVAALALFALVAGVAAPGRRDEGGGRDEARRDWGAAAGVAGSVALATAGLVLAWLRWEDEGEDREGRRRWMRRAVAGSVWGAVRGGEWRFGAGHGGEGRALREWVGGRRCERKVAVRGATQVWSGEGCIDVGFMFSSDGRWGFTKLGLSRTWNAG